MEYSAIKWGKQEQLPHSAVIQIKEVKFIKPLEHCPACELLLKKKEITLWAFFLILNFSILFTVGTIWLFHQNEHKPSLNSPQHTNARRRLCGASSTDSILSPAAKTQDNPHTDGTKQPFVSEHLEELLLNLSPLLKAGPDPNPSQHSIHFFLPKTACSCRYFTVPRSLYQILNHLLFSSSQP